MKKRMRIVIIEKRKIIVEANNKTIKSFIRLIKKIKAIKKVDYYIID